MNVCSNHQSGGLEDVNKNTRTCLVRLMDDNSIVVSLELRETLLNMGASVFLFTPLRSPGIKRMFN